MLYTCINIRNEYSILLMAGRRLQTLKLSAPNIYIFWNATHSGTHGLGPTWSWHQIRQPHIREYEAGESGANFTSVLDRPCCTKHLQMHFRKLISLNIVPSGQVTITWTNVGPDRHLSGGLACLVTPHPCVFDYDYGHYVVCQDTDTNYFRYSDVIMSTMASQITGVSIIYWTVCSGEDKRKHQSSAFLAFVPGEFPTQRASDTKCFHLIT